MTLGVVHLRVFPYYFHFFVRKDNIEIKENRKEKDKRKQTAIAD